jgi:UDP-N-acetylmuramate--alanine ligase
MVAEADESDRSFLKLSPTLAIITNIDREHLEAYGSFDRLLDAFADFGNRVPFYGAIIACLDDGPTASLRGRFERRVITYGFTDGADVQGRWPDSDGASARCDVRYSLRGVPGGAGEGVLNLGVPGVHNLQNALAAVAVGLELGVPFERLAAALQEFHGAERRYQQRGAARGITVIDDYGHHPTEIAAVLRAARSGHPRRIVAVFQPHRYSRTRDLLSEFGPALGLADVVVLTDIYPAGELPIPGVDLTALADASRPAIRDLHVVPNLNDVPAAVAAIAREGDLVLTLGAGSISAVGDRILAAVDEVRA